IERTFGPSQQPSFPIRVALANRRDVLVLGYVPAWTVVVPTLADRDDLSQRPASKDSAHLVLVRRAEPLRPHLHHLRGRENRLARQFGVLEGVRHGLLAV